MRRLICLWCSAPLFCALAARPALAVCQFATTSLAFGVVDVARGADSTGEISVSCQTATSFEVAIVGNGGQGNRYLSGPDGARLTYDVYPDATRSVPWTDGSGSGAVVAASGNPSETTKLPVYGRVPIQKAVPAGQYLDALTVSVTF